MAGTRSRKIQTVYGKVGHYASGRLYSPSQSYPIDEDYHSSVEFNRGFFRESIGFFPIVC